MNRLEIEIRLQACITQREGMIAENQYRTSLGNTIAYGEDAFDLITEQLSGLVTEVRNSWTG